MHIITIIASIATAQALDGAGDTSGAANLIGHVITGGGLIITSLAAAVAYLFKSLERRQEKALERQAKGHEEAMRRQVAGHDALTKELRATITHERTERAKVEQTLEETMGLMTDLTAAVEQLSNKKDKRSNGA